MWISVVQPAEATGLLKDLYEAQARKLGRPTEITMLGSLYPELVEVRLRLYDVVESCPSSLSPRERQAVALAAAALLGSGYLLAGVRAKFLGEGGGEAEAALLEAGKPAGLSPAAEALAIYARKVTAEPGSVTAADVDACRAAGASDLDVLDANSLAAYYAYLARVLLGLGVWHQLSP